jgi:hypothetical protein
VRSIRAVPIARRPTAAVKSVAADQMLSFKRIAWRGTITLFRRVGRSKEIRRAGSMPTAWRNCLPQPVEAGLVPWKSQSAPARFRLSCTLRSAIVSEMKWPKKWM